jgi:hypothetical protein
VKHTLTALHPGGAVQDLVGGRPAQDQRGRLGCIDACRDPGQVADRKRAIVGVRSNYRHVGDAVAKLKIAHAVADLIDLPDNVIAHHERRPQPHRLRVQMTPDQHLGVVKARSEDAYPYLAGPLRRSARTAGE